MPDIGQPESVKVVERRLDGQFQGGGRAGEQPAKKVTASYEEAAKAQPADDRITILGIPVEQITPATKAALGSLIAEINHLRGQVKRYEKNIPRKSGTADGRVMEPEVFFRALSAAFGQPAPAGAAWTLVLVHVPTYEDVRRSSGLLAANGVLADVGQRLQEFQLAFPSMSPDAGAPPTSLSFASIGYVGGSNLAALTTLALDYDTDALAQAVRTHLTTGGYAVSGIDMALVIKVAAATIGAGESATLALGRADHLLRSG